MDNTVHLRIHWIDSKCASAIFTLRLLESSHAITEAVKRHTHFMHYFGHALCPINDDKLIYIKSTMSSACVCVSYSSVRGPWRACRCSECVSTADTHTSSHRRSPCLRWGTGSWEHTHTHTHSILPYILWYDASLGEYCSFCFLCGEKAVTLEYKQRRLPPIKSDKEEAVQGVCATRLLEVCPKFVNQRYS